MARKTPDDCRFILVGTSHSGNIGAAARAMKTMALTGLDLVAPTCEVDDQARAMASHAVDVVEAARSFNGLNEALAEHTLVLGLTARPRRDGVPALDPAEAAAMIHAERGSTAVLFGRERSGLTNDELGGCHRLIHIPANPDYPSLNLAAAVQLMAYEIYRHAATPTPEAGDGAPLATGAHLEGLHEQIAALVEQSGYSANQPREVLGRRLRNFINRSRPSVEEVNLLRGILKRILR
ncbi:MAG: RNA methyltransferase [Spiribacter sp.]|nr:RNA methyltransferase [Spiribacter sp.]